MQGGWGRRTEGHDDGHDGFDASARWGISASAKAWAAPDGGTGKDAAMFHHILFEDEGGRKVGWISTKGARYYIDERPGELSCQQVR